MTHRRTASVPALIASTLSLAACCPRFESRPSDEWEQNSWQPDPYDDYGDPSKSCFTPYDGWGSDTGCPCTFHDSFCDNGSGYTCADGFWARTDEVCEQSEPPPEPPEPEGPEEKHARICGQRFDSADEQVATALSEANLDCVYDDDCMLVGEDTGCWSGCPWTAIAIDGSASFLAAIDVVNGGLCLDFATECSEFYEATACSGGPSAICTKGFCELE